MRGDSADRRWRFGGLTTAITLRHQGIAALLLHSGSGINIAAVNRIADRITQHIVTAPSTYELIGRIRLNLPTDVGML